MNIATYYFFFFFHYYFFLLSFSLICGQVERFAQVSCVSLALVSVRGCFSGGKSKRAMRTLQQQIYISTSDSIQTGFRIVCFVYDERQRRRRRPAMWICFLSLFIKDSLLLSFLWEFIVTLFLESYEQHNPVILGRSF
jgi:hypothetical protein